MSKNPTNSPPTVEVHDKSSKTDSFWNNTLTAVLVLLIFGSFIFLFPESTLLKIIWIFNFVIVLLLKSNRIFKNFINSHPASPITSQLFFIDEKHISFGDKQEFDLNLIDKVIIKIRKVELENRKTESNYIEIKTLDDKYRFLLIIKSQNDINKVDFFVDRLKDKFIDVMYENNINQK